MVRYYQHKLVRSQKVRLLAVRTVTQDNKEKAKQMLVKITLEPE